jgi:predicted 3-demethylubiquinone-9 3-methyltransferase (glyoxalase superfamily)
LQKQKALDNPNFSFEQIVPDILIELLNDPDKAKSQRVTNAMLLMVKIDIKQLEEASNQA